MMPRLPPEGTPLMSAQYGPFQPGAVEGSRRGRPIPSIRGSPWEIAVVKSEDEHFARLRKAIEARDRFLAEHPELQALQEEITGRLDKAGSAENRMAVLDEMMRERTLELGRLMQELSSHLSQLKEEAPPETDEEAPSKGKIIGPAEAWPQAPDREDEEEGDSRSPN